MSDNRKVYKDETLGDEVVTAYMLQIDDCNSLKRPRENVEDITLSCIMYWSDYGCNENERRKSVIIDSSKNEENSILCIN